METFGLEEVSVATPTNFYWVHAGYEHNYSLRKGWQIYWQVKTDLCINGKDLFRTGIVLGFKIPTSN